VRRRSRERRPIGRTILWVGAVVAVAGLAAFAMTTFSGARGAGDEISGEIRLSTVSLLADAGAAFTSGDPDRAIELYSEVLEIQPTNVEALTYRGWLRYQLGDKDAAAVDFDTAIEFDPEFSDVRVFRAVAALDREDFTDAADELALFDASNPSPVAQQLVTQRQLRERIALATILPLIESGEPIDFAAEGISLAQAQVAGETFVQLADPATALAIFDGILEADEDHAPALAWRGWTLALTAESGAEELFGDAERWLDASVASDPDYPDARVFRAFVFRRLDRLDEAAVELQAYEELGVFPSDMEGLINEFGLRELLGS
jgi:tetratricopeptide (TPR) repeat protein